MAEIFGLNRFFNELKVADSFYIILLDPSSFVLCNKPGRVPEIWSPESFASV